MKKIFISSDFEGTAGVTHWDETEHGKHLYEHFAQQMTREVVAACEGALAAGCSQADPGADLYPPCPVGKCHRRSGCLLQVGGRGIANFYSTQR